MDSRQALQELQSYQSTRKPPQDYYAQAQNELGVGASQQRAQELRGLIRGTEQSLRGVEASVSGRTQGSLTTEAQRSRLANLERQPIAERFREQQGALSEEEAIRQNLLGEAGRRAGFAYQGDADRQNALQQQYQNVLGLEQQQEARRQFEEQMKLSREQEQRLRADTERTRYNVAQATQQSQAALTAAAERQKALEEEYKRQQRSLGMADLQAEGQQLKAAQAKAAPYQGNILDYLGRRGPLALTDILGISRPF